MPDRSLLPARFRISRRRFLQGSGAAVAGASITAAGVACGTSAQSARDQGVATWQKSADEFYDQNSPPPPSQPPGQVLHFFTLDEAKTVDALVSRVMPGSAEDPGAHEAGVLTYIDYRLAANEGFDQPTYHQPPFAHTYEGNTPPAQSETDKSVVWVKKAELDRYGYQSPLTSRETYRTGLVALDGYCQAKFGKGFADLDPGAQDEVVGNLAKAEANAKKGNPSPADLDQFFKQPTAGSFFKEMHADVINGMFSDPEYGGNRDKVGWKLIGYAGAQRGYTPNDMLAEQIVPPQSIAELHAFHPGEDVNSQVILPVSGTTHHESSEKH